MIMRNKNIATALIFVACLLGSLPISKAQAETYSVNAIVPYATPTQPATIQAPVTGSTVSAALQQVSGTCDVIAPVSVVSIWRDGTLLGSATCSAGVYSLSVMLVVGQNSLVARTANANGVFGPDSLLSIVTYTPLPTIVTPLPTGQNQPANPSQQVTATNAGAQAGLSLTTQDPFSLITTDNTTATIRVVVGGGDNPYVLSLNWGDGSTETHAIDRAGTYEFTHSYRTQRGYTVFVRVRDVKGVYTEYVYAVVSNQSGATQRSTAGGKAGVPMKATDKGSKWVYGYYVGLLLFILFLAVSTYRLGYRRAKRRYEEAGKSAKTQRTKVKTGKR